MKPKDGLDVNGFSGSVEFHQDGDRKIYEIQVYPGFTPLRVEKITCYNRKGHLILLFRLGYLVIYETGAQNRRSNFFFPKMFGSVILNFKFCFRVS